MKSLQISKLSVPRMRNAAAFFVVAFIFWSQAASPLIAQMSSAQSKEYIEASSPLKTGGTITHRFTPTTGKQVFLSPGPAVDNSLPQQAAVAGTPVGNTNNQGGSMHVGESMPAVNPQLPPLASASIDPWNSAVQRPTLGIGPRLVNPTSQWFPQRPSLFGSPPPPQSSLMITGPDGAAANYPPTIIYPQPQTTVDFNQFSTNPNGLRPMVQFQNLPPGTYVGQGIVGQPKAYVDGQPVRNLFRYILP